MSGKLIGQVFAAARTRNPTARYVLVAIAEHANDDGTGAFPSLGTLARETGLTRRTVYRQLVPLEANGDLTVIRQDRKVNHYVVHPGRDTPSLLGTDVPYLGTDVPQGRDTEAPRLGTDVPPNRTSFNLPVTAKPNPSARDAGIARLRHFAASRDKQIAEDAQRRLDVMGMPS